MRRQADAARQRHADLLVTRSGLASRIDLLEQLERRQEGLGTGVREVLDLVAAPREPGPTLFGDGEDWSFVVDLVANCLTVPHEVAPLIDLALGDQAQCFLVRDPARLDAALQKRAVPFARPRRLSPPFQLHSASLTPVPGTGCWADELVKCDSPELAHLPAMLLGTTRIVADLAAARAAAAKPENTGLRFVTRRGELLEATGRIDGRHAPRRNRHPFAKERTRECARDAADMDVRIAAADRDHTDLRVGAGRWSGRSTTISKDQRVDRRRRTPPPACGCTASAAPA